MRRTNENDGSSEREQREQAIAALVGSADCQATATIYVSLSQQAQKQARQEHALYARLV